jgi:hypothetical protein
MFHSEKDPMAWVHRLIDTKLFIEQSMFVRGLDLTILTPHTEKLLGKNAYVRAFFENGDLEYSQLTQIPLSTLVDPSSRPDLEILKNLKNRAKIKTILEEFIAFAKQDLLDEADLKIIYKKLPALCENPNNISRKSSIASCIRNHINDRLFNLFRGTPKPLLDGTSDTFDKLADSCALYCDFKKIVSYEIQRYIRILLQGKDPGFIKCVPPHLTAAGLNRLDFEELYFSQRLWDVYQNKPNIINQTPDSLQQIEKDMCAAAIEIELPFEKIHEGVIHRFLELMEYDLLKHSVLDVHPLFAKIMDEINRAKNIERETKVEPLNLWKNTFSNVITIAAEEKLTPDISTYLEADSSPNKKQCRLFDPKVFQVITLFRDQLSGLATVLNFNNETLQKTLTHS